MNDSSAARFNILVADDDPASREMVEAVLNSYGYRIQTIDDGMSAWDMVQREQFDLLVVDLNLPGLNGYDLIARCRMNKDIGEMPIVVMSGASEDTACERAFSLGATGYIIKPINWPLFAHEIWSALRNHTRELEIRELKNRLGVNALPVELAH